MSLFAIADLHLSFGPPKKTMDLFGELWKNHGEKIAYNWRASVQKDDLVLIPGDISWAKKFSDALIDLEWLDALPGKKLLIKGNHDYWWSSESKMHPLLPPSIYLLHHNSVFNWNDYSIGGTRLWDSLEFSFSPYINFQPTLVEKTPPPISETKKIFERELIRLEMSLEKLDPKAKKRICMTHYPPIGAELQPSKASTILEKYHVTDAVFGHLHSLKEGSLFGTNIRGINYFLTSSDYLKFSPLKIS